MTTILLVHNPDLDYALWYDVAKPINRNMNIIYGMQVKSNEQNDGFLSVDPVVHYGS